VLNHSYFGDMLLGEAPFAYLHTMREEFQKLNLKKRGLSINFDDFKAILLLLSMLDCHSVNSRSWLTQERYPLFMAIQENRYPGLYKEETPGNFHLRLHNMSRQIININEPDCQKYEERKQKIQENLDVETFKHLYLQYYKDLVDLENPHSPFIQEENNIDGLPAVIHFLNQLCHLHKTVRETFNAVDSAANIVITFRKHQSTDTEPMYTVSRSHTVESCVKINKPTFTGLSSKIITGHFNGFWFEYNAKSGYLKIINDPVNPKHLPPG
jgi:hypothetical protein